MRYKTQQTGFSLIELMVAMVLGLIVSAVSVQIFIGNKGTYRLENSLSRLQENGRYVVENIVKDLRMAGYNGCRSRGAGVTVGNPVLPDPIIANAPIPFAIDGTDSIRGYNDNGTGWLPLIDASLNLNGVDPLTDVVEGTDVLNIQRASSCGAQLVSNILTSTVNIPVNAPNNCGFEQNQAVMITNCLRADVFQISNDAPAAIVGNIQTLSRGTTVNSANALSAAYITDASVFRWHANAYFIGTSPTSGEPALFRSTWNPNGDTNIDENDYDVVELADGVEDMQIQYGEDTGIDEYADVYRTANNVLNWGSVRSIRINLLLRSEDFVTMQPQTITFNGGPVGGADRRLRMVYTTTVSLRNNIP